MIIERVQGNVPLDMDRDELDTQSVFEWKGTTAEITSPCSERDSPDAFSCTIVRISARIRCALSFHSSRRAMVASSVMFSYRPKSAGTWSDWRREEILECGFVIVDEELTGS